MYHSSSAPSTTSSAGGARRGRSASSRGETNASSSAGTTNLAKARRRRRGARALQKRAQPCSPTNPRCAVKSGISAAGRCRAGGPARARASRTQRNAAGGQRGGQTATRRGGECEEGQETTPISASAESAVMLLPAGHQYSCETPGEVAVKRTCRKSCRNSLLASGLSRFSALPCPARLSWPRRKPPSPARRGGRALPTDAVDAHQPGVPAATCAKSAARACRALAVGGAPQRLPPPCATSSRRPTSTTTTRW